MDKANIIISIIIVLCIAAAVTAYGLTNTNNPMFSGLSSMSADNNGIGNNTTLNGTNSSVATTTGSSGSSGSGYDDSGSSNGGYSSDSSSSSSSSSSDSGSDSSSKVSASYIKSDAWNHIGEEGYYPGTPYYSDSYWYVSIYDENGTVVDSLQYTASGSYLGRG